MKYLRKFNEVILLDRFDWNVEKLKQLCKDGIVKLDTKPAEKLKVY